MFCTPLSILDVAISGIHRVCIFIISLAANHGDGLKTFTILFLIFWPLHFQISFAGHEGHYSSKFREKNIVFLGVLSSTNI